MEQLSGLDASFLSLETKTAPMHIGGVSILDPQRPDGSRLTFDGFRDFMASRLGTSRTFRQRLATVPLSLGRPYWIEDPEFDLDRHVERTVLPEPGGARELEALMSWEFSQCMPRDRPLWQMLWVDGLDSIPGVPAGAVGLIGKIHHAAIDGVSGAEILGALFDLSPTPREVPAVTWQPEAPPATLDLLRRTGRNLLRQPGMLAGTVGHTVQGVARAGSAWGFERVQPPPMPFTAPRSRLNAPVSKDHVWAGTTLTLDRIKAIRAKAEVSRSGKATVNDIVLTICAGALRAYLGEREALPEKPLVAMVPISVRAEDERGTMGNQVSAMLVQLATDEPDPYLRLQRIHDGAGRAKVHHRAIGARTLTDYSQIIPFSVAGLAARLYTRTELAQHHRPIFNLVITNVPGPQAPLYVHGARLLRHLGGAPIFDGMGLTLACFSYDGRLAIGATSCRRMMPDIHAFVRGIETAIDDLEAAVEAA